MMLEIEKLQKTLQKDPSNFQARRELSILLAQNGFNDMIEVLGIKTDMDLRSPENGLPGTYILGTNVEHIYYDVQMYASIFTDEGKESVRAVFSNLAKPEKYPVYLHCTHGLDRTGTICFVLEALLGLSEEDAIREYELSALIHKGISREYINVLKDILNSYEGETFSQRAENYLLSTGVSTEEIASIKDIFLLKE